MTKRLQGKIALVVGAGSSAPGMGNGKATAIAFAREGATVVCADVNEAAAKETEGLILAEGGQARHLAFDVTDSGEVGRAVAAVMDEFGRIDVLDNNVGIAKVGGVVELDETEWDRVHAINLKGPLPRVAARSLTFHRWQASAGPVSPIPPTTPPKLR